MKKHAREKQNTQIHNRTSPGLNHNETNYALNVPSKPTNPATNNKSITKQLIKCHSASQLGQAAKHDHGDAS
jgi:hypothetical protein